MPARPPVSYPGIYVQEVPSGTRAITGVSTSIAVFIGMVSRGELDTPTRIFSFAEFERNYGYDPAAGELPEQVRQFFLNGGSQAYIMRIAKNAVAAAVELKDQFHDQTVLALEARSAGTVGGQIRIQVDYNTSDPESTFNMTVIREEIGPSGFARAAETERFRDLTMNPDAGTYVVDVLNRRSRLVRARAGEPLPKAINGFSMAGVLMNGVEQLRNIIDKVEGDDSVSEIERTGSFQISVDGSPYVTAHIRKPVDTDPVNIDSAIGGPINTALSPLGRSVTVGVETLAGYSVLKIESKTAGGSVRIASATSKDIAMPMQMGVAQGGLEVDGYAVQRPAPTGFFTALGTDYGTLANLDHFIEAVRGDIAELTMTDATAPTGVKVSLDSWPATGNMSTGSLDGDQENSLLNVRENLRYLAARIAGSEMKWNAELHGLRIVLTPEYGGPDADRTAQVATGAESDGTDLGAEYGIFNNSVNVRQYQLGNFDVGRGDYQVGIAAGLPGDVPGPDEYRKAFEIIDREVDLFNLMILPRAKGQSDAQRNDVWSHASRACQKRRAFLLVDPMESWQSRDDVADPSGGVPSLRMTGIVKDHAAIYWPRLRVPIQGGGERHIDPSGSIAGLMSRIDATRGVWKAPAGTEADLRGIRGVQYPMSDEENGVINPLAVNGIRVFPNGIVSWGARTMDGFDNSGNDDYKYVPVRRLALFLEESLYRGLKWVLFEPNAEPLWSQIRMNVGAFMHDLFRQGAFKGEKPRDAYFVKCDAETTTQNDINLGIVNIWVGFAPLKPAEFVILYLQQMAGVLET